MKLQTFSQLRAQRELEQLATANRDLLSIEDRGCEEGDWLADIIVDCKGIAATNGRADINPKERFTVSVPADFPFAYPLVEVKHDRFADLPHVQWGRNICLYASANDWDPRRGMAGFVHRLALWLESAATGKLEGPEAPWHIPVAYPSAAGHVVAKVDIPDEAEHANGTWTGWAIVACYASYHLEIVGWLDAALAPAGDADWISWAHDALAGYSSELDGLPVFISPIMALASSMGFEYPRRLGDLLDKIKAHQLSEHELPRTLLKASRCNKMLDQSQHEESVTLPLLMLIGTPSWDKEIKTRVAALAAWHIEEFSAAALTALDILSDPHVSDMQSQDEPISVLRGWPIEWARVFDQRPQVTLRRDEGRPAQWLRCKRVLVLGCGALGAPLAEHCLRAGCQSVELVDTGGVHPGLLVRQPYEYDDIGLPKVSALADRLQRIRPEAVIVPRMADALDVVPESGSMPPDVDLIIDATANHAVAAKIERNRWRSRGIWPPVFTVVIGHKAERGIGMLSPPGATGAAVDILRQVLLECGKERRLADFPEDFLQENSNKDPLVPEPGCSEPTFAGSSVDVSAIASTLLNGALAQLSRPASSVLGPGACRSAQVVRNLTYSSWPVGGYQMSWDQDTIVHDKLTGYEIRISSEAWETMRHAANIADIARMDGPRAETGGSLYGQIDSASMVIWVAMASGPPGGSVASSAGILLNTADERPHNKELLRQSRGAISFIGMWHSHPNSAAEPSLQDILTMAELTSSTQAKSPKPLLLLILGSGSVQWDRYLKDGTPPGLYAQLFPENPQ
jgi:integrative and conjugative element protein (TIGR02256 family)